MKSIQRLSAILFCGALLLGGGGAYSRPVDLSAPANGIGAANYQGNLEIWREVDQIDLGEGMRLPLRIKFSSEKGVRGIFGEGFWCPLIEAHALRIRPDMIKANLPCGKALYLRQIPKERNKFRTLDHQWTGTLTEQAFTITRDDGWALEFFSGRLVSLTTDNGRKLKWIFNGTQPSAIYEGTKPILKVEVKGDKVTFFSNLRSHVATLGKRPHVSVVQKQTIVEGFDECLVGLTFADKTVENFDFSLTEEHAPKLVFTDRERANTTYTWDATTGHIRTQDGWKYEVGAIADKFALPAISRIDSAGKRESVYVDKVLGIHSRTDTNGVKTVVYTFPEPGPLYEKVQKVDQEKDGVEKTIYKASYDEAGRLIREVDEKGFSTVYSFSKDGQFTGKTITRPMGKDILAALAVEEEKLLDAVTKAKDEGSKGDACQALGLFYIFKLGDHEKALNLLPQIKNRRQIFNIRFHSIDRDLSLSGYRKSDQFIGLLKEFPEEKELLEIAIRTRRDDEERFELAMKNAYPQLHNVARPRTELKK